MKGLKTVFVIVMMLCLYAISASAANIGDVLTLRTRIDGDDLLPDTFTRVNFIRGDMVDVELRLNSSVDLKDVEVVGFISGYEFNHLEAMSDSVRIFDMRANVSYREDLSIRVPMNIDDDNYKLRIVISDRDSVTAVYEYNLRLDSPRHGFVIKDVVFSPSTVVEAGRALLTTARIENVGQRDQKSVKVTVAIPELGISASDFIDRVKYADSATSEEMYMRIPVCAEPGLYEAVLEVRYNDLREATYGKAVINVVESDACIVELDEKEEEKPRTIIALGSTSQNLVKGEAGALYPLTITNNGENAVAYTVSVEGIADFASVEINPVNTFILNGGDSQAVFIYLTPVETALVGQKVFTVDVKSGDELIKQIPLTANIEEGDVKTSGMNARDALEVGLIVLVVLLIVLAVIVGVKKLKKDEDAEDDEEVEGKTYY
jgi:uncharacterized membrane protein